MQHADTGTKQSRDAGYAARDLVFSSTPLREQIRWDGGQGGRLLHTSSSFRRRRASLWCVWKSYATFSAQSSVMRLAAPVGSARVSPC